MECCCDLRKLMEPFQPILRNLSANFSLQSGSDSEATQTSVQIHFWKSPEHNSCQDTHRSLKTEALLLAAGKDLKIGELSTLMP